MKQKVLSVVVILALCLAMMSGMALAEETCVHEYDSEWWYSENGYHYPQCMFCEAYDSAAGAKCSDENQDHYCDICYGYLMELCSDANDDHACDICSTVLEAKCSDENQDHLCDNDGCANRLSECEDTAGNDKVCDICGEGIHPHAWELNVESTEGDGEITFRWTGLYDVGTDKVKNYTVYSYEEGSAYEDAVTKAYAPGKESYSHTFTGLTNGVTYEVGVCALYESEYSAEAAELATPGTCIVMQINSREMEVNGRSIENDVAPVIVGDRTLVPIRVVTELLGGTADWEEETRTVTLTIDGNVLKLVIDQLVPDFGTSATIIDSRTYVPIRYIMEMLGAEVEWIAETEQIIIQK